jgi:lipoprotein-anchoring transpeptidase ErfK/SrfK
MNWKRAMAGIAALGALVSGGVVTAEANAAPALVPGTPCTATAKACVDLSSQRAWLIKDGKAWYTNALIASGRNHSTPAGTYHVTWKDKNHRSSEYHNAPMPYSVFFDTHGRAFHEGSIQRKSGGCVHLTRKSAKVFFQYLQKGDEVQIRGYA